MARKRAGREQNGHASREDIAALVSGFVSSRKRQSIAAHLAHCPDCRKLVANVTASEEAVPDPAKNISR